jgi:hypothetical protein
MTETTNFPEEYTETNVLVRTSFDRLALLFGDDSFGRLLRNNEVVVLKYVKVEPITDYTTSNITLSQSVGNLISSVTINTYQPEDSLLKISRVAPGYFSAKRRMVNIDDHENIIVSYPGIISSKHSLPLGKLVEASDVGKYFGEVINPPFSLITTPLIGSYIQYRADDAGATLNLKVFSQAATVLMSYLFDDEHTLLTTEEEQLQIFLKDNHRILGEQIIMIDPTPVSVDINLLLVIEEDVDTPSITTSIQEFVNEKMKILQGSFFPNDLYLFTSQISGVIRPYIVSSAPGEDTKLSFNEYFKLNSLVVNYSTNSETLVT